MSSMRCSFWSALAFSARRWPIFYFRILQLAGSSNLMLVTIIVPVFAVGLDAAILGQFVTGRNMADLPLSPSGCWFWTGGWSKAEKGASD